MPLQPPTERPPPLASPVVSPAPLAPDAEAGCANCGAPVTGPFCAACGQEHAQARVLSLREFFAESLDTFLSLDSKVLNSLLPLVTRPGALTQAYRDGRRAPYLSPMKVFVVLNVGYFFLVQLCFPLTAEMALGSQEAVAREAADRGLAVPAFTIQFEQVLADVQPTWVFVLVPLFAIGVAVLHLRQRRPLALHLAFAFHVLSFVLVAFVVLGIGESAEVALAVLTTLPVYLTVALRRVYEQSWGWSLIKGGLTTGWFFVLLFLYYSAVTGLSLGQV